MALPSASFTVPAKVQLTELINLRNNTTFTPDELIIGNPVVIPDAHGRSIYTSKYTVLNYTANTRVTCQHDSYNGTVDLTYQRVDLSYLFSLITPELLEVNLLDEQDQISATAFLAEIKRKYGIVWTEEDVVVTVNPSTITVTASPTSLMYTEGFTWNIVWSLRTRIRTVLLDGFTLETGDPGYPTITNGQFSMGEDGLDYWGVDGDSVPNFYVENNELVSKGLWPQWTPCIGRATDQLHSYPHWKKGQVVHFEINVISSEFQFPQFDINGRNPQVTAIGPTHGEWVKKSIRLTRDTLYWAFACWSGWTKYRIRNVSVSAPE